MARIFITGSADGLGQLAAKELVRAGHQVVLHARNAERASQAIKQVPGAEAVLTADLSSMEETKALAAKAADLGDFDAIIHNAGVYQVPKDSVGAEGLPTLLAVNTLAPYILTCLMRRPERIIYMSSGMHLQGSPVFDYLPGRSDGKGSSLTYSDTKLHDVILAMAVARMWPDVMSNAVNPGWVPTKMGGAGAPDSFESGIQTQTWLATSNDAKARVSGHYFHHMKQTSFLPAAQDSGVQEEFLNWCGELTGVSLG